MARAPRPHDEIERLKALQSLRILDTANEERFDRITRVARRVFDVPVASIGFVDEERLWFKSACGISRREASRDTSLCSYNIMSDEPLIIPDLRQEPAWVDFPTVNTEPFLRFYAGHPLLSADGRRVGSLCVTDYKPHAFTEEDHRMLLDLAGWAQSEMLTPRSRSSQLEVVLERERMEQHPRVDSVTRFWRRDVITQILETELGRARPEKQPVGLMLIGLDDFSRLAGQIGPMRSDVLFSAVAQSVRFSVRPYDSLGRWDSDRFLVVLPGADLARCAVAAERIRQNRAANRIDTSTGPLNLTITVAVSSSSEDPAVSAGTLIAAAERALKLASDGGGNRTRLASIVK